MKRRASLSSSDDLEKEFLIRSEAKRDSTGLNLIHVEFLNQGSQKDLTKSPDTLALQSANAIDHSSPQ